MINEQTFDQIWDVIKDKYDVKDWETCSMRTLDRAERLSIKMRDAFRLIEGIALSELEENK